MLSVLLVVLIHNSVPHFHHVHETLEFENSAKSIVEHNYEHEPQTHHGHNHSESLDLWAIFNLIVDHHSHSTGDFDLADLLNDTIKNKELNQTKIQPFVTVNEFQSIVHFETQFLSFKKNYQTTPPPDRECLSLRGPPALG